MGMIEIVISLSLSPSSTVMVIYNDYMIYNDYWRPTTLSCLTCGAKDDAKWALVRESWKERANVVASDQSKSSI